MTECPDCGAENTQVLGFSCNHARCPQGGDKMTTTEAMQEDDFDLLDLAHNLAGIDEGFLVSANLNTLRVTLRELRDEARLALDRAAHR